MCNVCESAPKRDTFESDTEFELAHLSWLLDNVTQTAKNRLAEITRLRVLLADNGILD